MNSAAEVLDLLAKDSSEGTVTRVCAEIADWAKEGHAAELTSLARGLEAAATSDKTDAYETVVDLVEDQLALTQDPVAIDGILALASEPRLKSLVDPRTEGERQCAFASRLGYAQTKEAFAAAFDRAGGKQRELFACWMHELVLRRVSLASVPAAQALAEELAKDGHPLGGLPLALRPLEREAPSYMPLYGDRGLTGVLEALASGPMSARSMPPPDESKDVKMTEVAVDPAIASAVKPWGSGKKGKIEMRAFEVTAPIEARLLGSWLLRALPLESTKDVPRSGLECKRVTTDAVFGTLFAAAANGGAHSTGLGGAYGRRAAWTSLAVLAGAAPDASIEAIEAAAGRAVFLSFGASGPWFHDVAWDLGVLALHGDGRKVVVLAATDAE
ncbi:MAG: hypothetical protein KIT84_29995 [Labilithrix sp.]|nr:hypothetical protein [Labilithrix sp.]MCW5815296.1 hypothetical protein [Labilithrix sp.]